MVPIVVTVMERLRGAGTRWVEDLVNHVGTGTRLEGVVWIDRVSPGAAPEQSEEDARGVDEYSVNGMWEAHVRKDKFHLGRMYDKVWGDYERPYGFFIVRIRCRSGTIVEEPYFEITVEDGDQEPKQYALRHAEQLIRSKVAEVFD